MCEGDVIGYYYGEFVTRDEWIARGVSAPGRFCTGFPLNSQGQGFIIGHAECPLIRMDASVDDSKINAAFDWPTHPLNAESDPTRYLPVRATRFIAAGERICSRYQCTTRENWKSLLFSASFSSPPVDIDLDRFPTFNTNFDLSLSRNDQSIPIVRNVGCIIPEGKFVLELAGVLRTSAETTMCTPDGSSDVLEFRFEHARYCIDFTSPDRNMPPGSMMDQHCWVLQDRPHRLSDPPLQSIGFGFGRYVRSEHSQGNVELQIVEGGATLPDAPLSLGSRTPRVLFRSIRSINQGEELVLQLSSSHAPLGLNRIQTWIADQRHRQSLGTILIKDHPIRIMFNDAVRLLFTYPAGASKDDSLTNARKRIMLAAGPLLVQMLVCCGRVANRTASRSTALEIHDATFSWNRSVGPDDSSSSVDVWRLQQQLFFLSLIPAVAYIPGSDRKKHQSSLELSRPDVFTDASEARQQYDCTEDSLTQVRQSEYIIHSDVPVRRIFKPNDSCNRTIWRAPDRFGRNASLTVRRHIHSSTEIEPLFRHSEPMSEESLSNCLMTSRFIPNRDPREHRTDQSRAAAVMSEVCKKLGPSVAGGSISNDSHAPISFDHTFPVPPSGFGVSGTQEYHKRGVAFTAAHDEEGDSAAVNYMVKDSEGVACWIGWKNRDLSALHNLTDDFHAFMIDRELETDYSGLLELILSTGTAPLIRFQLPGDTIHSPFGKGCAHAVLSLGTRILQFATNSCTSAQAIDATVDHWKTYPVVPFNCGIATPWVLPLLFMVDRQWPLSQRWREQATLGRLLIDHARKLMHHKYLKISEREYVLGETEWCTREKMIHGNVVGYNPIHGCNTSLKWVSINGLCVFCFRTKHPIAIGGYHPSRTSPNDQPIFRSSIRLMTELYIPQRVLTFTNSVDVIVKGDVALAGDLFRSIIHRRSTQIYDRRIPDLLDSNRCLLPNVAKSWRKTCEHHHRCSCSTFEVYDVSELEHEILLLLLERIHFNRGRPLSIVLVSAQTISAALRSSSSSPSPSEIQWQVLQGYVNVRYCWLTWQQCRLLQHVSSCYLPALQWFTDVKSWSELKSNPIFQLSSDTLILPPLEWEEELEHKNVFYSHLYPFMLPTQWVNAAEKQLDDIARELVTGKTDGSYVVKGSFSDAKSCVKRIEIRDGKCTNLVKLVREFVQKRHQPFVGIQAFVNGFEQAEYRFWCQRDNQTCVGRGRWHITTQVRTSLCPNDRDINIYHSTLQSESSAPFCDGWNRCTELVNLILSTDYVMIRLEAMGLFAVRFDCGYDDAEDRAFLNESAFPGTGRIFTAAHQERLVVDLMNEFASRMHRHTIRGASLRSAIQTESGGRPDESKRDAETSTSTTAAQMDIDATVRMSTSAVRRSSVRLSASTVSATQSYIDSATQVCLKRWPAFNSAVELSLFKVSDKVGLGVKNVGETIRKGAFVLEYCGDLLVSSRLTQDERTNVRRVESYVFECRIPDSTILYCLDATRPGPHLLEDVKIMPEHQLHLSGTKVAQSVIQTTGYGLGRYLNHSSTPNLTPRAVDYSPDQVPLTDSEKPTRLGKRYPRVLFFADRDISPGEELTFLYEDPRPSIIKSHPFLRRVDASTAMTDVDADQTGAAGTNLDTATALCSLSQSTTSDVHNPSVPSDELLVAWANQWLTQVIEFHRVRSSSVPSSEWRYRLQTIGFESYVKFLQQHGSQHWQYDCQDSDVECLLRVGPSTIPGLPKLMGAFTKQACPSGTVLSSYPGWIISRDAYKKCPISVPTATKATHLTHNGTEYLVIGKPEHPAAQINHCTHTSSNIRFAWNPQAILTSPTQHQPGVVASNYVTIKSTGPLEVEEVKFDYTAEFWQSQPFECDYCLLKLADYEFGSGSHEPPTQAHKKLAQRLGQLWQCTGLTTRRGCRRGYHDECFKRMFQSNMPEVVLCGCHAS